MHSVSEVWASGAQGKSIYASDKNLSYINQVWPELQVWNLGSRSLHTLYQSHSVDDVWARLGQGDKKYAQEKWSRVDKRAGRWTD